MQVTKEHLKAWFDELNDQYFSGELPMPRLEVGNSRTRLGSMSCKWRRSLCNKRHYDHCIRLSNYYDISEEAFRNVLLHEMIHYYISVKGLKDTSAHGAIFRRIMSSLNAQGWHIEVHGSGSLPIAERNSKKKHTYIVAAITASNGAKLLTVVSGSYVNAVNKALKNSPEIASLSWYTTSDNTFSTWPKVRSPRAKRVSKAMFEELTNRMTPLNV